MQAIFSKGSFYPALPPADGGHRASRLEVIGEGAVPRLISDGVSVATQGGQKVDFPARAQARAEFAVGGEPRFVAGDE